MKVLFLPGYACLGWIWDEVVARLMPDQRHPMGDGSSMALEWPVTDPAAVADIDSLADWLGQQTAASAEPVTLVGHSMGGLVALRLASRRPANLARVIWVDSFITTPPPFFRNLLMPGQTALEERVQAMMRAGSPGYPEKLRKGLRELNVLDDVRAASCQLGAIYGGRGEIKAAEGLRSLLAWPKDVASRVKVAVVRNACHFAMLEDPAACADAVRELLE